MRFRLTPEERRARFAEGRWGWANPRRMTRREFIGLRDRMHHEKMKKKQKTPTPAGAAAPMKRKGGKLKWLILLIILAIAAYIYLRKTGRVPQIIKIPWIERFI